MGSFRGVNRLFMGVNRFVYLHAGEDHPNRGPQWRDNIVDKVALQFGDGLDAVEAVHEGAHVHLRLLLRRNLRRGGGGGKRRRRGEEEEEERERQPYVSIYMVDSCTLQHATTCHNTPTIE